MKPVQPVDVSTITTLYKRNVYSKTILTWVFNVLAAYSLGVPLVIYPLFGKAFPLGSISLLIPLLAGVPAIFFSDGRMSLGSYPTLLRKLASTNQKLYLPQIVDAYDVHWVHKVPAVAQQCISILEARLQAQNVPQTLLRASASTTHADNLLRSASGIAQTMPEETAQLLRSAVGQDDAPCHLRCFTGEQTTNEHDEQDR